MFKILLPAAMHGLLDGLCERHTKDRLSFMRFIGLELANPVADANTKWAPRDVEAGWRGGELFTHFDASLRFASYLAFGRQIVDVTIVAAPSSATQRPSGRPSRRGASPKG